METKAKTVFVTSGKAVEIIATITFLLLLTIIPIKGHAVVCNDPNKSTGYFTGYSDAQSDFHSGHGKNQNVNSPNSQYSQDYKQGYQSGWNDAEFNINMLERSYC
jgi:hypothetical protein